jgi:glyoxylase-like metal-dependent hydrolase (beta-lactamase superfamily II)
MRISETSNCESSGNSAVFLCACFVFTCVFLLFCTPGLRAAEDDYHVQQLKPNVFVWVPDDVVDLQGDPQYSRAATVGFIVTDQGVVVIGATNNPEHARDVLYEIRKRTDTPVIDVIDLDPDGDQVLGNEVFAEQRAQIFATDQAAAQMHVYEDQLWARRSHNPDLRARLRGIHFTLPTRTFGREVDLRVSHEDIRVLRVNTAAGGHSGADAVVFLPAEKVLFLGDLFENGYMPAADSRDVRSWIAVLGQLETWKADIFVPAHGLPGNRQDVERFRQFLQWIVSEVKVRIQEGQSLRQVEHELLTAPEFRIHAWENVPQTLTAVYQQLVRAMTSAAAGSQVKASGPSPVAGPLKPAGMRTPGAAGTGISK